MEILAETGYIAGVTRDKLRRFLDLHRGATKAFVDLSVWRALVPDRFDSAGRKYMGSVQVFAWTESDRAKVPNFVEVEIHGAGQERWFEGGTGEEPLTVWERLLKED